MALEWSDVDLSKRQLCVQRSDWKGHVSVPKSGRLRYVPLTTRLAVALREHRHLRSRRVLHQDDGDRSPLTQKIVQDWVRRAARIAKVNPEGVHVLRHTFCSHLAMRGRAGPRDSRARRASGSRDDAAIYAPESRRDSKRDSAARCPGSAPGQWRHFGDSRSPDRQVVDVKRDEWWRRRESNPRPRVRYRGNLHA